MGQRNATFARGAQAERMGHVGAFESDEMTEISVGGCSCGNWLGCETRSPQLAVDLWRAHVDRTVEQAAPVDEASFRLADVLSNLIGMYARREAGIPFKRADIEREICRIRGDELVPFIASVAAMVAIEVTGGDDALVYEIRDETGRLVDRADVGDAAKVGLFAADLIACAREDKVGAFAMIERNMQVAAQALGLLLRLLATDPQEAAQ